MDLRELREHIDSRLDRVESKLERIEIKQDSHIGRISSAETSITWIRGTIQFGTTLLIALLTSMAGIIYKYMTHR